MATSERYQVLERVIAILKTITKANGYLTDVRYVSPNLNIKSPDELGADKFPALFPQDEDEAKEAFAIGTTGLTLKSTLTLSVTAMVYDRYGDTALKRCNLIRDVEKALSNDPDLTKLLLHRPTPLEVVTDKGIFDKYSTWMQSFSLEYLYNHQEGG